MRITTQKEVFDCELRISDVGLKETEGEERTRKTRLGVQAGWKGES